MFFNKTCFSFTIFMFICVFASFANITEARIEYENGNIGESLNLYNNWLMNNHDSSEFTSILLEISLLNGDISTISKILDLNIKYVSNREQKKELFIYLAQMYELSSKLQNAQINYQNASLSLLNEIDYKLLLKSAEILILEGDLFLAESQLKEILTNSTNKNIIIEAELFYILLNLLHENNSIIKSIPTVDSPRSLYIVYLIEKANSNLTDMNISKDKIILDFKTSPEAALLRKKISELPDVILSLGLLDNQREFNSNNNPERDVQILNNPAKIFMIQAGSFKDQENAFYHSKDLISAGFEAVVEEQIINSIKYYKVLLYFQDTEKMSDTLKKLKEKGFDGFPVY